MKDLLIEIRNKNGTIEFLNMSKVRKIEFQNERSLVCDVYFDNNVTGVFHISYLQFVKIIAEQAGRDEITHTIVDEL